MAKFSKILSNDAQAELQKFAFMNLPNDVKLDQWKGYKFIPRFSADTAKYAYDKWNTKEGDVIVVSYPKTGGYWTCEILRQILFQDENSAEFFRTLPMPLSFLELGPSDKFDLLDKIESPRRLFRTHLPVELFNTDQLNCANAKVVYVLRNPRDQILSLLKYTQSVPYGNVEPMKSMIFSGFETFLKHIVTGDFAMHSKPGQWYPDHIAGWHKYFDRRNFCVVYYEDLQKDLPGEIKRLAEFLEVPLHKTEIANISENSSFENMKKNLITDSTLRSIFTAFNMRNGEVGEWKSYFTDEQTRLIDEVMQEKLNETNIHFTYGLQ